jgi:signal transduction histidine kinase
MYLAAWLAIGMTGLADFSSAWSDWLPSAALWFTPTDVGMLVYVLVFGTLLLQRYVAARGAATRLRLQVLQAQAEERRRIGRELHDGVAQELQGMRLFVDQAQHEAAGAEPARTQFGQVTAGLRQAIQEVRRLAADLAPPTAAPARLDRSLASLAQGLGERHNMTIHAALAPVPALPAVVTENLYRLAQEALRNACRHSGGAEIWLGLTVDRQQLHLTVRDRGRGFDPRAVPASRLGLRGMRERAALIGGQLELKTRAGQGTELSVAVPLTA